MGQTRGSECRPEEHRFLSGKCQWCGAQAPARATTVSDRGVVDRRGCWVSQDDYRKLQLQMDELGKAYGELLETNAKLKDRAEAVVAKFKSFPLAAQLQPKCAVPGCTSEHAPACKDRLAAMAERLRSVVEGLNVIAANSFHHSQDEFRILKAALVGDVEQTVRDLETLRGVTYFPQQRLACGQVSRGGTHCVLPEHHSGLHQDAGRSFTWH